VDRWARKMRLTLLYPVGSPETTIAFWSFSFSLFFSPFTRFILAVIILQDRLRYRALADFAQSPAFRCSFVCLFVIYYISIDIY
jgi:hypothetical protein